MFRYLFVYATLSLLIFSHESVCQSKQDSDTLILREGLVIEMERTEDIHIITPNAVVASVETGEWETPSENAELEFDGKAAGTWKKINADDNGWFRDGSLNNSYVYFQYVSEHDKIALVEGMGNSMVYVNGSPHSGNPYRSKDIFEDWEPRFDYSLIPVKLQKGTNEFLFECNRRILKAKIHFDKEGLILNGKDLTIPDILLDKPVDTYGSISIINATENSYKNLYIKTSSEESGPEYYPINQINQLSIYKTPFYIKLPAQQNPGKIKFNIELVEKLNSQITGGEVTEEEIHTSLSIELNVVSSDDIHKETFISSMDGSVQYYAVNPPTNLNDKPALFLSLHGAGVEAINQAQAYGHKNWGYIVAPTNRRPYGYNWENWGRLDALEVLDIAKEKFNIDENRVYLTGHSMGGHGTWHLGINYPDQFAAIGPSAGWISIWGYRIRPSSITSQAGKVLIRSAKQSDTYALSPNLKKNGIYIIHGSEDDNVRPEQAESIIDTISVFHKNYIYHEEPGAGHWWDNSDEPGADCVDWMPMFDFFAHHSVPGKERIRIIDFVTANPAISSKNYWVEIINQIEQQKLSKINIKLEFGNRKYIGTTDNIEILSIDASTLSEQYPDNDTVSVQLDDQLIPQVKIPGSKKLYLKKENGKWGIINEPSKENKYPIRTGNFREVLKHDVVFIYGTKGNNEENQWAFEKARYDAERIWYQGNGSIEVIKDVEFDAATFKDRNVVIYGNSETNSAWEALLKDSPVQVNDGEIIIGEKEYDGDDLACLLIRPRKDSEVASVAVVTGTGIEGMKLANFAQCYHPYVSFPDVVIYNSEIIKSDEQGVKLTGYFGNDWSLENGEFVSQ